MAMAGVIFLLVFSYIPMFGIAIAFKNLDYSMNVMKDLMYKPWVGMSNFVKFVTDAQFGSVMYNTLMLGILELVITFPIPILFALLLNELRSSRFRKVVQTTTYFPYFISWVVFAGIVLNLFLFASKYIVGLIVQSVSIRADGLNNLTDAASNIVSIVSFKLAEKPADKEHPYGHERSEYIASLFVGLGVAFLGYETLKDSILKILRPTPIDFQWYTVAVLVLSIVIKLVMFVYNRRYALRYDSSLLMAAAVDSRSDCIGTTAVLISTCLSPLIHFELDGYMGVIVSLIIFYSAYDLLKSVINDLIGEAPNPETAHELENRVLSNEYVLGVHDLRIHQYGPTVSYATVHAEVNGHDDIMQVHNAIDQIERQVREEMGVDLTIHMDPVLVDDPLTRSYLSKFESAIRVLGQGHWSLHDFRIIPGHDEITVDFDLVVPFDEHRSEEQIEKQLLGYVRTGRKLNLQVTVEHPTLSMPR